MNNGLAEFQSEAVKRIVERFNDPQGSRRFLLADEVGLGKTRVAAGVIQAMSKRKAFTVVYVCSNSEIAEQNRDKLAPGAKSAAVNRLPLLATESQKIDQARRDGELQVFSFTPGTSLDVRGATGIEGERQLLLYLLARVWGKRVNRYKWRRFFCCTCKWEDKRDTTGKCIREGWSTRSRFASLRRKFSRKVAKDFQLKLRKEWNSCSVDVFIPEFQKPATKLLAEVIDQCVDTFNQKEDRITSKNRNTVIGALRDCLSKVALDFLEPNLVLLDEFQKFSHILKDASDNDTVVGRLFTNRQTPALILSATPYKAYSLDHEDSKHRPELLRTLAFLYAENNITNPENSPMVKAVVEKLDAFKDTLLKGNWFNGTDQKLLGLKREIEGRLKPVMCRTERNWYIEDAMKGVNEFGHRPDQLPSLGELEQYVQLRRFLLDQKIDDWNITDFWKSAPFPLAFMDGNYALIKRLRHRRSDPVPSLLLPSGSALAVSARDHLKIRTLTGKVFGQNDKSFPFLWIKPAYTYEKNDFFPDPDPKDPENQPPTKFLVFSHWKFVPKTIAVMLSQEAEQRIGRRRKETAPLQFRQILSFTAFDVCYPSPVLADCVNPAAWAREAGHPLSAEEIYKKAEQAVRKMILNPATKVKIQDRARSASLWRVIARLESVSSYIDTIQAGLYSTDVISGDEKSAHYGQHRSTYCSYINKNEETLFVSNAWVRRLTLIALYSPAICLLRSMRSVFGEGGLEKQDWDKILKLGINQLRNYFNKRVVQAIIRSQKDTGRSYAARVLRYCQRAHFQAVLDEYVYVLHASLSAKTPEGLPRELLRQLAVVFGIGSGSPAVNQLTRTGRIQRRPTARSAHFAMAFGDDVAAEAGDKSHRTRKTAMREAFNSPFWPFVLATTSVGQEGLDFHLYCRDIMHWNLPSNPVDLEQREGRINRRNSLAIRRNISVDHPFALIANTSKRSSNLWADLFVSLRDASTGIQRFKHGLYPHWIYQGGTGACAMVRRHMAFYMGSKDVYRYQNLKLGLSLYRLVFGQPRQQDILETLLKKHPNADSSEVSKRLARYIINLSPIPDNYALHVASREANLLLKDAYRLARVLGEVRALVVREAAVSLQSVHREIQDLIQIAEGVEEHVNARLGARILALQALLYLVNPYDAQYDFHEDIGYQDDIAYIREVHRTLFSKGKAGIQS